MSSHFRGRLLFAPEMKEEPPLSKLLCNRARQPIILARCRHVCMERLYSVNSGTDS